MTAPSLMRDTAQPLQVLQIRGAPVVLDTDLARAFGVESKRLNEQVKRNPDKFDGFAFQLAAEEYASLRSHFATSNVGRGGRRHLPHVFTEHGVVMAATVIKSETAIAASRFVIKVRGRAAREPDLE
jgi:hypothetical protein